MIEIKNLSLSYGKNEILKDLSVNFEKGKITSVIGPNGCGKTTLLNTIAGIISQVKGSVFIDGKDLSELGRKERAKKIAYLIQGGKTPDMTVENLILHGRFPYTSFIGIYSREDKKIAAEVMEKLSISHLAKRNINTLSGGMKQNVFIAMALSQNSDYILMDEPTTYLDISKQSELLHLLKTFSREKTGVVSVLHDLPLALSISDSIAVMSAGKLIMQDTPEKIYESGILKEVFGVEIKKAPENDGYYYRLKPEGYQNVYK